MPGGAIYVYRSLASRAMRTEGYMAWTTAAAVYFVIWWTVLFAVLPFGVRSHAEAGTEVEAGNDPGAPVVAALGRKAIWTTVVATIVFAILWVIYTYRLVTLDDLSTLWGLIPAR